jgi:hypothetical protein
MANEALTLEQVKQMAADVGMTRLADEHVQQLLRATRLALARRDTLPAGTLGPADEPAHVFRLDGEDMA